MTLNLSWCEFLILNHILYQFLYSYDFDGAPAVEALGAQAIADTDGDQLMEVVDAFGEPLLYEIQQRAPENQNTDGDTTLYPDGDTTPDVDDTDDDADGISDLEDLDDDGDGLTDEGHDGIDNNNNGQIDEFAEAETSPPYPTPIRGIEIRVRCYEPYSKQVLQITIRQSL